MWKATVVAGVLTCIACSSASLLVKAPLTDGCTSHGLRGCDMIVTGMLRYAEGNEAEAKQYLAKAAAMNSPEEVQRLAVVVQGLRLVPGAEPYAAPLGEALSLLTSEAQSARVEVTTSSPLGSSAGNGTASATKVESEPTPNASAPSPTLAAQRILTAATDPAQTIDGVYSPTERHVPFACSRVVQEPAVCGLVAKGPLYLTDVVPLGDECKGQFLAVVRDGAARWVADGPLRLVGANLFVRENELMVMGRRTPEESDATTTSSCRLLWSGYRPYSERSSAL